MEMRTTVTLEPDTEQIVRQQMRQRRVTFEQALNDLVREGRARTQGTQEFQTTTASMGDARVNLNKAVQLAGELEDDTMLHKVRTGS